MNKSLLLPLVLILFIIPYSGLTLAEYKHQAQPQYPYPVPSSLGSYVIYGANGQVFQYGYSMVDLAGPICKDVGCYNVCEGSYGCMTLQYGDALNGRKASRCPSCINSGCCNCRSCCATRGCTRE